MLYVFTTRRTGVVYTAYIRYYNTVLHLIYSMGTILRSNPIYPNPATSPALTYPNPPQGHIVTLLINWNTYTGIQLRTQAEDLARHKALKNRTANLPDTLAAANGLHFGRRDRTMKMNAALGSGGDRVYEKMVDRYAVPGNRGELPVHGMGMEMGTRRGHLL